MGEVIVQSRGGITLLGGGLIAPRDLSDALELAPALVAADGGAEFAILAGILPEAIIGDLDSLSQAARDAVSPAIIHSVAEQDSTDFGKCLRLTRAPFYIAVGFLGRRLDHTLASLTEIARAEVPVIALGEGEVIFRAPPHLVLDLTAGTRVSLYPMGPVSGSSTGLKWPIDRLGFAPAGRIGTSNAALGPVTLDVVGAMLVIVPREALGAVLNALRAAG